MRKVFKLLVFLSFLLLGSVCALAESGVTILNAPDKVDLYVEGENVFYSGSIRYRLDENTVVKKLSLTQYNDLIGFDIDTVSEGNRVYRADLRGYYTRLTMETFGIPDVLDFTFTIETDSGSESVTFPVHLHENVWDARRVSISMYEAKEAGIEDQITIPKPTLDGKIVNTGLINNKIEEHPYHNADPFFGSGWVNDFSYSADTLELVDETSDAFILKAIAPGRAETICTVREINSTASLSIINASFMVRSSGPETASIKFSVDRKGEARFSLQEGSFSSNQLLILIEDSSSDSDTLDADFDYEASIQDTDIVSKVEFIEVRPSNSRPAIVMRYKLSDVKKAGETQLVINVTYKGASYRFAIPIIVFDEDLELKPSGSLLIDRTWSNFYFNLAYCNELDTELSLEMGADYQCLSGEDEHTPTFSYELLNVQSDCPYDISFSERSTRNAQVLVSMKPKTMPMNTGSYPYAVKYTISCCGITESIVQTVPVLIVSIPDNKLDYLHTPPTYMCLDRDSIYWDREILTPINRYCDLSLEFASNMEAWNESYFDRYLVYKPSKEGLATWKYTGTYANGDVTLHSGETMIFTREEYGKLDESTNLTAIYNNFDLTPEQQDVPRLFPPNENWANEWFLKAQLVETDAKNSICYELTLVDEYENEVALPESTTLYLPYPEGMSAEEAAGYEFVVVHEAKDGTQIYSTQDGTLIKREYGLEMTVSSLSPFTINWGTEEEMNELLASGVDTSILPQTGDNSLLTLWLFMLSLAAAALLTLRRQTA